MFQSCLRGCGCGSCSMFIIFMVPSCAKRCLSVSNTITSAFDCEHGCCGVGYQQYCCEKDDHWNPEMVFGTVLGGLAALLSLMTCTVIIIKACNHTKMRTGNTDGRTSADMLQRSSPHQPEMRQGCNPHQNVNHLFTSASVTLPPPYLDKPPPYIVSEVDTNPTAQNMQLPNPSLHARYSDLVPLRQQSGQSRDSRQRPQSAVSLPPPYTEIVQTMAEPPQYTSLTDHDRIIY
ncbi:hypothetical protein CHS0354_017649 [Potamilus streckersoni]|uniref:Uncharacterized protein n=1 Tax=Potamilus streckersoni TaxID=2493646 RepID=A0AAE0T1U2_9BIVA|nr:hypothetical protein CHS0354_017649 [Potamilus streckersoni]